ncbi:MAG: hypothetical protein KME50_21795 [Nostoc desertorum CM1-VF14]|nr:hypothetical protein [Nostoc desertorum CM1-VF14]
MSKAIEMRGDVVRLCSPTGEMRELWRVNIQKERSLGKLKMRSQFISLNG